MELSIVKIYQKPFSRYNNLKNLNEFYNKEGEISCKLFAKIVEWKIVQGHLSAHLVQPRLSEN